MKKTDPGLILLLNRMLEKDPLLRATASQCLADPFF